MAGTSEDVVAIGGSIVVDGTVKGSIVAVGGDVRLGDNASIFEDVVTVGGHVSRHPSAVVKGDITQQSGTLLLLGIFLMPVLPLILIVALVVWLVRRNRAPTPARVENRP